MKTYVSTLKFAVSVKAPNLCTKKIQNQYSYNIEKDAKCCNK